MAEALVVPTPEPAIAQLTAKAIALPGVIAPINVDYVAYDPLHARLWVPVGNSGSAHVFDISAGTFARVDGFTTAEREARGTKRLMGPNAVTIGDGVVYVGNRGTGEVCVIDPATLKRGTCIKLPTPTDGVVYVASAKEVWVTTPRDQSLTILDATKPNALKLRTIIRMPGEPEGYAVDEAAGLFYTNLEDKNQTLVIDIKSHTIKATWSVDCGDSGPRGVARDAARNFVFVACTTNVLVLDGAHAGAVLGKLDTGAGVDNIDYHSGTQRLYIAASKAAKLVVAHVNGKGQPSVVATGTTAEGCRNAVTDVNGDAYVVDPGSARLLIFAIPKPR